MHIDMGSVATIKSKDNIARRRAQQPGPSGSAEIIFSSVMYILASDLS